MKFRKKPVVIEASRFDGSIESAAVLGLRSVSSGDATVFVIDTLEGPIFAMPGDWIITGVEGELYPCKPDIFQKTYEPAE